MDINNPAVPAAGATKELQIPIVWGNGGAVPGVLHDIADWIAQAAGRPLYVVFSVPHDFSALISAELIVLPDIDQVAADVDLWTTYGAAGELDHQHSETEAAATYNWLAGFNFAIDCSPVLTGIAAGDIVGLRVESVGVNNDFRGIIFRLRYT